MTQPLHSRHLQAPLRGSQWVDYPTGYPGGAVYVFSLAPLLLLRLRHCIHTDGLFRSVDIKHRPCALHLHSGSQPLWRFQPSFYLELSPGEQRCASVHARQARHLASRLQRLHA